MSVLVSDRTESKFEAITFSIELHDMLIEFMQSGFGVKDLDHYVRVDRKSGSAGMPRPIFQNIGI